MAAVVAYDIAPHRSYLLVPATGFSPTREGEREQQGFPDTRKTLSFTRAENGACRRSQRRILATFGTSTPCEALRRPHGAPARGSAARHVALAALDPPRAST